MDAKRGDPPDHLRLATAARGARTYGRPAPDARSSLISRQPVSVLLIEDDPGYARFVRRLLSSQPVAPRPRVVLSHAESLRDGLAQVAQKGFGAMLLDLGLPDSHGLETLVEVRERAPGIPVVVLTAAADELLAIEALQRGAQDYLLKTEADGEMLGRAIWYAMGRQRLLDAVESLSLVDHLTGLYNRRGFFTLAERQMADARRRRSQLALVLADVDGLKEINDRHGHPEGDRMLALVGQLLRRICRDADIAARFGGDEFVLLLSGTDDRGARRMLDRVQARVRQMNRGRLSRERLALSVGLACSGPGARRSLQRMVADADADMYRQKRRRKPNPRARQ